MLWLMSEQSASNISPLHRQRVKGRTIIVTEDPKLHLVWKANEIYIKPLPAYILSYSFWEAILLSDRSSLGDRRDKIRKAALGYLRTFFYLIRHESDFNIALRHSLIPATTWKKFCSFSAFLDGLEDNEVTHRYAYGELRLTRLNFYTKVFLRKWNFQRVHTQYGAYFARFYGPILFVFGLCSVLLNACQLAVTLEGPSNGIPKPWEGVWWLSRALIAFVLILCSLLVTFLVLLFLIRFVAEWRHAIFDHIRKQRRQRCSGKVCNSEYKQ